jgi:hypothetical protein
VLAALGSRVEGSGVEGSGVEGSGVEGSGVEVGAGPGGGPDQRSDKDIGDKGETT